MRGDFQRLRRLLMLLPPLTNDEGRSPLPGLSKSRAKRELEYGITFDRLFREKRRKSRNRRYCKESSGKYWFVRRGWRKPNGSQKKLLRKRQQRTKLEITCSKRRTSRVSNREIVEPRSSRGNCSGGELGNLMVEQFKSPISRRREPETEEELASKGSRRENSSGWRNRAGLVSRNPVGFGARVWILLCQLPLTVLSMKILPRNWKRALLIMSVGVQIKPATKNTLWAKLEMLSLTRSVVSV